MPVNDSVTGGLGGLASESTDETVSVSVVVPVGRVDDELSQQLDALSKQTFVGSWQIVLSMNTPDDRERARLEQAVAERDLPPTLIADSSDVRSASHARNVGATESSGVKLLFCDGDDIADVEWVEQLVAALEFYDAVGGFLDEELLAVPGQEDWRPPATPGALPTFLGHPFMVSANMGVKRSIFEAVGGFDSSLIRGEDIALSWHLLERGIELGYCESAVIYYRHRRGLGAMMRQHYLYGRGFSQILTRQGTPGESASSGGLRALKPNGQPVARKSIPHLLRRGSIATGRVIGLIEERLFPPSH